MGGDSLSECPLSTYVVCVPVSVQSRVNPGLGSLDSFFFLFFSFMFVWRVFLRGLIKCLAFLGWWGFLFRFFFQGRVNHGCHGWVALFKTFFDLL